MHQLEFLLVMHNIGFLPIYDMPIIFNLFWSIVDPITDICTFFPPNCREHQVSPVVDVTYYYCYRDGPLADANLVSREGV